MQKPIITICVVSFNTADFLINTYECLQKITKNPFLLHVRDNNSKIEDYKRLEAYAKTKENFKIYRVETDLRGGMAHGTALNELIGMVETPYFSILDADATWLKKDWDQILIDKFDDTLKVFGTQNDTPQKPMDFPLMFAIIFETAAFRSLNIDFRPRDMSKYEDTGFEMRGKYLAAGLKGGLLLSKKTRTYKDGPFGAMEVCEEYYLEGEPHVFASHFGRGSTMGANKYLRGYKKYMYKIPVLGTYLLLRKGMQEKEIWINTCRKLVTDQTNTPQS